MILTYAPPLPLREIATSVLRLPQPGAPLRLATAPPRPLLSCHLRRLLEPAGVTPSPSVPWDAMYTQETGRTPCVEIERERRKHHVVAKKGGCYWCSRFRFPSVTTIVSYSYLHLDIACRESGANMKLTFVRTERATVICCTRLRGLARSSQARKKKTEKFPEKGREGKPKYPPDTTNGPLTIHGRGNSQNKKNKAWLNDRDAHRDARMLDNLHDVMSKHKINKSTASYAGAVRAGTSSR